MSASGPKNPTYQRALQAFFEGGAPAPEQLERLPEEVDGLTVRRKAMIDDVLSAPSREVRLRALRALNGAFGLPPDLRVIYLALTPEDESLTLAGLNALYPVLREQSTPLIEEAREQLRDRLALIETRTFNEAILSAVGACRRALGPVG